MPTVAAAAAAAAAWAWELCGPDLSACRAIADARLCSSRLCTALVSASTSSGRSGSTSLITLMSRVSTRPRTARAPCRCIMSAKRAAEKLHASNAGLALCRAFPLCLTLAYNIIDAVRVRRPNRLALPSSACAGKHVGGDSFTNCKTPLRTTHLKGHKYFERPEWLSHRRRAHMRREMFSHCVGVACFRSSSHGGL